MAAVAEDYAARIGRAQKAYQEYGTAGRKDLQTGASQEADKIRAEAKTAGVDLNGIGTKNSYGTDYTSYYKGDAAGAYDPTQAGRVARGTVIADTNKGPETTTTTNTPPPGPSSSDLISSIYNNNYESQAAKIRAARDQALSGLAGQDTQIKSEATANLNQNDVTAAQQANSLREHMANLGIGQSGDYISEQVGQNTATQQNASNIRQNASQRLEQLLALQNQIKNSANDQDLALLKDIQSQIAKAQLDQSNADRQFGLQEAGVTNVYKGQLTPAGQGQILSNQNQQITNQINQLKLQNLPQELKLGLQEIEQKVKTGAIDLQTAQYQLDELKDPNSVTNRTKALDLQMKELDSQYLPQEKKLQLEELRKRINQIGAKPVLTQAEKEMQQVKLDTAKAELEKLKNPDYKGLSADQIYNNVRSMYTETVYGPPDLLGKAGPKMGEKITTDPAKREQMFLQVVDARLPTEAETYQVLHMLGLTKDEIATFIKKNSSR